MSSGTFSFKPPFFLGVRPSKRYIQHNNCVQNTNYKAQKLIFYESKYSVSLPAIIWPLLNEKLSNYFKSCFRRLACINLCCQDSTDGLYYMQS